MTTSERIIKDAARLILGMAPMHDHYELSEILRKLRMARRRWIRKQNEALKDRAAGNNSYSTCYVSECGAAAAALEAFARLLEKDKQRQKKARKHLHKGSKKK